MNSRNLCAVVIVLAWTALPLPLRAQSPSPAATPKPAESMMVRGVELYCDGLSPAQRKTLATRVGTLVGHPYSEAALEGIVHNSIGGAVRIGNRIFGEPVPGGVKIILWARAAQ